MKQVVMFKPDDTVDVKKMSNNKTYAMVKDGIVYKAHRRINPERWEYVSMADAVSRWSSDETLKGLTEQIFDRGIKVFQFGSQAEFFEWALKQLNGEGY